MKSLERIGVVLGIAAIVGAPMAIYFKQWDTPLKVCILVMLTWLLWLTAEVILIRKRTDASSSLPEVEPEPALPRPRIREFHDDAVFVHSRDNSPGHQIPTIDSQFLDWHQCTFCIWIKVDPGWRVGLKTPRYLFSHTSNDDGKTYPDSFSLFHSHTKALWGIMLHGDPKAGCKPADQRECLALSSDDGVRLFTVRWSKKQGDVEVLIDGRLRIRLESVSNWPRPAKCPIFLGGWVRGGWDSYIKSKFFDVQVFDRWLSDEQLEVILSHRPDL